MAVAKGAPEHRKLLNVPGANTNADCFEDRGKYLAPLITYINTINNNNNNNNNSSDGPEYS
jgi:hypothetical protein